MESVLKSMLFRVDTAKECLYNYQAVEQTERVHILDIHDTCRDKY